MEISNTKDIADLKPSIQVTPADNINETRQLEYLIQKHNLAMAEKKSSGKLELSPRDLTSENNSMNVEVDSDYMDHDLGFDQQIIEETSTKEDKDQGKETKEEEKSQNTNT